MLAAHLVEAAEAERLLVDDQARGRLVEVIAREPLRGKAVLRRRLEYFQQALVRAVGARRQRLRDFPVGAGACERYGRLPAILALLQGHRAGDHGRDQQHADAGERRAQAALRAVRGRGALGEEVVFGRVEIRLVDALPLERGGEPRTAVELARVTAAGDPVGATRSGR